MKKEEIKQLNEKYQSEIDNLKESQKEYDMSDEVDELAWHEDEMQITMYSSFIEDLKTLTESEEKNILQLPKITIDKARKYLSQLNKEEITFSRFVELLNCEIYGNDYPLNHCKALIDKSRTESGQPKNVKKCTCNNYHCNSWDKGICLVNDYDCKDRQTD